MGRLDKSKVLWGISQNKNGFDKATDDLLLVTRKIQEDYPNTPIILLGHSMGSFLV